MAALLHRTLINSGLRKYERIAGRPKVSELRALYLSHAAHQRLFGGSDGLDAKLKAGIVAKLNRFVEGARLSVSTAKLGDARGELKGLKGYGLKLFQLRFYDVCPQFRLLGVFPKRDVFLGMVLVSREELDGKWDEHCKSVLAKISSMGTNAPECLSSQNMENVLSNWRVSK